MKLFFQTGGCVGLIFVLSACSRAEEEAGDSGVRLAPVEVLEVTASVGYEVQKRFVGIVEARRRSVLAFELAGTVVEVAVEEGAFASAGQVLARIDTSRLEARREELAAALAQAEATRDLAAKVRERVERLIARGGVSLQDLDEAVAQGAAAEAGVAQIEAQLRSVEVDFKKSVLRAPYDGTAARRHVDEGTVVSPNALVLEWLEAGALEIRVGMASDAVSGLQPGAMVDMVSPTGEEFGLEVLRILPQRDRAARTVDVILAAPPERAALRDGDLVTALRREIITERGFFLPREALTESVRGLWACYVAVPDAGTGAGTYRLDRRDLELLHDYPDRVFVRGAIREGDRVLASGIQKVAPDQRVKLIEMKRPVPGDTGAVTARD